MKSLRANSGKFLILVGFGGIGIVGLLLFTHHAGFAIKIINYIYWILLVGLVFELFNYVKK